MVSDEKVMSTCSKRIHEVKHTLHLNDESKHLDTGIFTFNFHVQFPRSFSRSIPTFTFRNKNTRLTNRCLHRHFHVHIQKQKHRTHKQMFTQAFPRSNSETKTLDSQTDV